jgi:transglutaminase/protease-like cytokinesis protein 3
VIAGTVYDDALEAATLDRSLSGEMYVNRSAYGALITGSTICSGYSRAFKAICDEFDVPCWVVLGTKGGQAHAWNLVLIDDSSFYVDCTRADVNGETENAFLFNERSLEEQDYEISPAIIIPGRE